MLKIVKDVAEFHRAGVVPMPDKLDHPPNDRKRLRIALIEEEVDETIDAIRAGNIVEVADGIADSIVVLVGTALEYGIDLTAVWNEVHRSNMAKFPLCQECFGEGSSEANADPIEVRGPDSIPCEGCNGRGTQLILREDGKILKPETWTPPDIAGVLKLVPPQTR